MDSCAILLLYCQRKAPPAFIEYEAGWVTSDVERNGDEKNLLHLPAVERRSIGRPNHSLVTIPTALSRLIIRAMINNNAL